MSRCVPICLRRGRRSARPSRCPFRCADRSCGSGSRCDRSPAQNGSERPAGRWMRHKLEAPSGTQPRVLLQFTPWRFLTAKLGTPSCEPNTDLVGRTDNGPSFHDCYRRYRRSLVRCTRACRQCSRLHARTSARRYASADKMQNRSSPDDLRWERRNTICRVQQAAARRALQEVHGRRLSASPADIQPTDLRPGYGAGSCTPTASRPEAPADEPAPPPASSGISPG